MSSRRLRWPETSQAPTRARPSRRGRGGGRVPCAAGTQDKVGPGRTNTAAIKGSIRPVAKSFFTGLISGYVCTGGAFVSGAIVVGGRLSGTGGGGVVAGTQIV